MIAAPGAPGPVSHELLEERNAAMDRARSLRSAGVDVWQRPDIDTDPWDLGAAGVVVLVDLDEDPRPVEVTAEALLRGATVMAVVPAVVDPDDGAALVVADLEERGAVRAAASVELPISDEQVAILRRLGEGASIPTVAAEMYLSVRTTERRVSSARKALGVRSTAAAVAAVMSAGGGI